MKSLEDDCMERFKWDILYVLNRFTCVYVNDWRDNISHFQKYLKPNSISFTGEDITVRIVI